MAEQRPCAVSILLPAWIHRFPLFLLHKSLITVALLLFYRSVITILAWSHFPLIPWTLPTLNCELQLCCLSVAAIRQTPIHIRCSIQTVHRWLIDWLTDCCLWTFASVYIDLWTHLLVIEAGYESQCAKASADTISGDIQPKTALLFWSLRVFAGSVALPIVCTLKYLLVSSSGLLALISLAMIIDAPANTIHRWFAYSQSQTLPINLLITSNLE